MTDSPSKPEFWRERYGRESQGWEIGRVAPPLDRWFAGAPPAGKRALVVGCGRGHEARMLAARGAAVVGVDFAPEALAEARALAAKEGVQVDFRERDLFALAKEPERYDLVVEHCCFCAIEPARRKEYVDVVADVLVEGGRLVGLFRDVGKPGGPPFSVDEAELRALFGRRFEIGHFERPADSIVERRGQEMLVEMRRR